MRMTSSSRSARPARLITLLMSLLTAGLLTGCGDPIYDTVDMSSPAAELTLTSNVDPSRYEWPLTRDGYHIAKPPQMAYITSFEEKLKVPDPVTAELVPWSNDGLDPEMVTFLNEAYQPTSIEMDVVLQLETSRLAGPQAFDVSADGTRLVVIEGDQLALYRTEDGSLVGHLRLPGQVTAGGAAAEAVRFCGKTKDFLVASPAAIIRISSKDASVVGQSKGCGEPIAQWHVTPDDRLMLVRTASGRLFGGDTQLVSFSPYDTERGLQFDVASLSPDGNRIGVVVNGVPRTYLQEDLVIVDQIDYPVVTLDPSVSIAGGVSSDAWVDGDGIFYTTPNNEGGRDTGVYHMFWKPLQISTVIDDDQGNNHYLMVASRFFQGKEQLVLFEYGPIGRNHSLPNRLDEVPIRYAHSAKADQVAIFDSRGLRLCQREAYRTKGPVIWDYHIYNWVDAGKFDEIEKLLEIIQSQTRLGFGKTPESLRTYVINEVAARWMYLTENDPDSKIIDGLEAWRDRGRQLGFVVDGLRHYRVAWNARGGGTINTVTQSGWQTYREHLELARQQLDKAIEMGNPPAAAFEKRISVALEQGAGLQEVDHWCRQTTQLYPTEIDPHDAIAFKLLPQWFGEQGDALSYVLSVSKMFESPEGEYKYVWLVNGLVAQLAFHDTVAWRSYDARRIRKGLEECFRRDIDTGTNLCMLWMQFHQRTRDQESADLVLRHLMETRAAPPWYMTHGNYSSLGSVLHEQAQAIRSH